MTGALAGAAVRLNIYYDLAIVHHLVSQIAWSIWRSK